MVSETIIIGGGASIKPHLNELQPLLATKFTILTNYAYKTFSGTFLTFQDREFYVPDYAKHYTSEKIIRHPDIYEELKQLPLIISINKNGIEEFKLDNTILLDKKERETLTGVFALKLAKRIMESGTIFLLGFDWPRRTGLPERDPNYNGNTDIQIHYYSKQEINHRGQGYLCFDNKTKVFTNKGWKLFKDLNRSELILTRKASGETEWSPILKYYEYNYNGIMKHIKSKGIDLLVTPNHKLPLIPNCNHRCKYCNQKSKCKNGYIFEQIIDLKQSKKIPNVFNWHGENRKFITIPKTKIKPKIYKKTKIAINNWCRFLGLYISEGYCNRGDHIRIYQNHTKKKDKYIKNILKLLPFKFSKYNRGWIMYSKDLYNFLKPLGLSNNKFIPENIKNLNYKNLHCLLESLIFGDGIIEKSGRMTYYTISKQLAEDVQEIAYKCGYYSAICINNNNYTPLGKKINHPIYCVHINKSKKQGGLTHISIKTLIKNKYIKNIKYKGKIYDIVTKNHTMWIKRNNVCIWSGNSYYENHNPNKDFAAFTKKETLKIYNVSLNSNIDCFEKISYEVFFKLLSPKIENQEELRTIIKNKLTKN